MTPTLHAGKLTLVRCRDCGIISIRSAYEVYIRGKYKRCRSCSTRHAAKVRWQCHHDLVPAFGETVEDDGTRRPFLDTTCARCQYCGRIFHG